MRICLQLFFDEEELAHLQKIAERNRMTASEWVRHVVRQAQRHERSGDPKRKLAAIRHAAEHSFPTGDIDQMLTEIAHGYLRELIRIGRQSQFRLLRSARATRWTTSLAR